MRCTSRIRVAAAIFGWAVFAFGAATHVHAALPIDLEVATDENAPPGSMQEWGKVLSELDLARLRLRGAQQSDQPAITPVGAGDAKKYQVLAFLNSSNELVFPGGKFRSSDRTALKQFLTTLPERFEDAQIERGPLNLPVTQFDELRADLATVVRDSTNGVGAAAAVAAIAGQIKTHVELDAAAQSTLRAADPLAAEFKGLTAGTALAATLRTADLALVPVEVRGEPITLRVAPLAPDQVHWPVGWKPSRSPKLVAPAMYKFTTVEIQNYTLAKSLEAMAPNIGMPIVFDQRTLTTRHIDPAAAQVKFPAGKTYIRQVVDRILAQSRLAGELRVDEADHPFYWATQYGPLSPHAEELTRGRAPK